MASIDLVVLATAAMAQEAPLVAQLQGVRDAALQAWLLALLGRFGESAERLEDARLTAAGDPPPGVELVAAMAMLEAGFLARAAGALARAEAGASSGTAPVERAVSLAVHAQILLAGGSLRAASEAAVAAVNLAAECPAPAHAMVLLAAAEVALAGDARGHAGELATRVRDLGVGGLLRARSAVILTRCGGPPAEVTAELERAIDTLSVLGAPRDVGLAYLAMAELEATQPGGSPVSWLARAQPLLAARGTAADQHRLRAAFRRFGRRDLDRVMDPDVTGWVEQLRHHRASLVDVLAAQRDARDTSAPAALPRTRADEVVDELLGLLQHAEDELIKSVELILQRERVNQLVSAAQELGSAQKLAHRLVGSPARFRFEDLLGESPELRDCLRDARRGAPSDLPLLITGESGTGKEMLAQAIHNASPRAGQPFVGVNVAAIPRELLESELFGYDRGAFTGAREGGKAGKFEVAERGTIVLDEIGDMPLEMQAKLLRVLQERTFQRLGGNKEIPLRARIIATTHRDLERAVAEGAFRLDLFHRIRVLHLRLPPLRERREDIPRLVEHYLRRYAERVGRRPIRVAPRVLEWLVAHDWPGNVRELANLIESEACLMSAEDRTMERVPPALIRARPPTAPAAPEAPWPSTSNEILPFEEVEKRAVGHALRVLEGNVAAAAKALNLSKATLYNKINTYGLRQTSVPQR
jgi:transcriptional regulator with PAS, ATPase and Fis domain